MTSEDWQRIRALFEQALEQPEAGRSAWLREACAGDAQLGLEVERLLALHTESDEFLAPVEQAALEAITPPGLWAADEADALVGERIGAYRLERLIAAGGMGVVFEATQERPQRRVALKMMRAGLATPEARRRFRYESEILARLHHPGIAQIHEAGAFQRGGTGRDLELPFFAMEYVEEARTILEHARERTLDLRARIELFRDVCAAVHHGHQKGVIHRDLKPGNILVDGAGQPKVIDFGIALATDRERRTRHTTPGQILGTLRYMSPEQVAGQPDAVDTRSDVYALGVVLYELLCDCPPHELDGQPIAEAARILREEAPRRPGALRSELRGDLEWILLKAIEKDPERRYSSASALEADLGRYLRSEPVSAGPPSAAYRLRKFVRRNRAAVLAAAAILLSLIAGLVVSTALYLRSEDARATAKREERTANLVNRFLDDTLASASPYRADPHLEVADLLEGARIELEHSLQEEPLVRAALSLTLGRSYMSLGRFDAADPLLRYAAETRAAHLGADDPRTLEARLRLASLRREQGRAEEAEQILRPALASCRAVAGEADPLTLGCRAELGVVLKHRALYEEAEAHLVAALAGHEQRFGPQHGETLATAVSLAELMLTLGRHEEAEIHARRAFEGWSELRGIEYGETMIARNALARALHQNGEVRAAEAQLRENLALMEAKFDRDHPFTLNIRNNLASVLIEQRRFAEAEPICREVLAARVRLYGEGYFETISARNNLAQALSWQRKFAEAEELHRANLAATRAAFGEEDARYHTTLVNLGLILRDQGEFAEAEGLYREAIERRTAQLGAENPDTLLAKNHLAGLFKAKKDYPRAEALYREVLAGRTAAVGEEHPETLVTMTHLSDVLRAQGALEEAEQLARRALELRRRVLGAEAIPTIYATFRLARLLVSLERVEEACEFYTEAARVAGEVLGEDARTTHGYRQEYALCLIRLKRFAEAEAPLLASHAYFERTRGLDNRVTRRGLEGLVQLYEGLSQPEKAAEYRALLENR